MAIKVYRLHQGKGQDGTGWFNSRPLNNDDFKSIKTDGKDVATSIPSPFARIDLFKSAFKWVAENEIEGKTAHHKLVSDALDIAHLFFVSQKYKDSIKIVSWNPNVRFDELKQGSQKHSDLVSTLKVFWDQDSKVYNFDKVNRLYLIINKYNNKVLGGTSPSTLFFAAPDLREVAENLNITIGDDKLFDDKYASLDKREKSFIEYIYFLSKQPAFSTNFKEFDRYLQAVKDQGLLGDLTPVVSNLTQTTINQYERCPVLDNPDDFCEILGLRLGVQPQNIHSIRSDSDFVIKSEISVSDSPLVLPSDKFTANWVYTTNGVFWNENNIVQVPNKNNESPEMSILPVQSEPYYWLSIGNFLEDKIIELPYTINSNKFIQCGSKKHLLPLTSTFFKYFKAENVAHMLKIEELTGGGVQAKLKIPVKKGFITYKKIYNQVDIIKLEVHLAILPFLRIENSPIEYTFGIINGRVEVNNDIVIKCFEKGHAIQMNQPVVRKSDALIKTSYFNAFEDFDLIQIGDSNAMGFIVPLLKKINQANAKIKFAIDFGTTNTHIEYALDDNTSISLDNISDVPLWQSLLNRNDANDPYYYINERYFDQELLPFEFSSNNNQLHFPVRTALVYNLNADFTRPLDVFRHVNNFLLYEKQEVPNHLTPHPQLKWSNYSDIIDEHKVKYYIEYLLRIVYYKSLLLGGDINKTSITWFYPVSMDSGEQGILFRIWKDAYLKTFNQQNTDNLVGIPESIAPYLFYRPQVVGLSLSIDIGGGSSDIAVFDERDNQAKFISSFKFAGNAIFGDGYTAEGFRNNSDRNGFVKSYLEEARKAIAGETEKEKILSNIVNTRKDSADFSSFLFSLENDSQITFSYTRLLEKDKRLKLSIFVFYGAIAYYSAILMKKSGIGIPKYILLSGSASKSASIIDTSEGVMKLSAMFKFIFEKVYEKTCTYNLTVKLSDIPKEITCKGALLGNITNNISQNQMKFWLGGLNEENWSNVIGDKDIQTTPKYSDISESINTDIENSILKFYSILDEYVFSVKLESDHHIDADAYDLFKNMRSDNIKDYLVRGLQSYYKRPNNHIEETLFFYPLIGILNNLSFELAQKKEAK